MNRRDFLKAGILSAGGLLAGCKYRDVIDSVYVDGKYDKTNMLIDDYDLTEHTHLIEAKATTEQGRDIHKIGTGFDHKGRVLTAEHVTDLDTQMMPTPRGTLKLRLDPVEKHYYIDGEETELIKEIPEYDLSVLDGGDAGYPIGDSDELDYGTLVALCGYSMGIDNLVKLSRVAGLEVDELVEDMFKRFARETPRDEMFWVVPALYNGDSGGPTYAFRDGDPEVVGMNKLMVGNVGGVHKINHILESIGGLI